MSVGAVLVVISAGTGGGKSSTRDEGLRLVVLAS